MKPRRVILHQRGKLGPRRCILWIVGKIRHLVRVGLFVEQHRAASAGGELGVAHHRRLRRDDGDHSEIVTFSLWDSRDSIRAFAGDDIDQAVFYPEDDRFLIERDLRVRHYEVVA